MRGKKKVLFGEEPLRTLSTSKDAVNPKVKRNDTKPDRPLFPPYFSQVFKPSVYYTEEIASNLV